MSATNENKDKLALGDEDQSLDDDYEWPLDGQPARDAHPASETFKHFLMARRAIETRIASRKEDLFDCLRDANGKWPNDETWRRLVSLADIYCRPAGTPSNHDLLLARAGKVGGHLKKALELITLVRERAELRKLLDRLNMDYIIAEENEPLFDYMTVQTLQTLIASSDRLAEKVHRNPSGRQIKQPLSNDCICELAKVYQDCTGDKATSTIDRASSPVGKPSDGSEFVPQRKQTFCDFVFTFSEAMARERKSSTIAKDIKQATKSARWPAFEKPRIRKVKKQKIEEPAW